jgi:Ca-activated chloride channel family protein
MTFAAEPWIGLGFLACALTAIAMIWAANRQRQKVEAVFSGDLLNRVRPPSVVSRRRIRDLLALFGLVLCCLALAEPRSGKELQTIRGKGSDLVIVLDLSLSMNAQDVEPSRMERARREIDDLLRIVESDRVGLVVYAGGAMPRMPLTVDHTALLNVVRDVQPKNFPMQGSALGAGIRSALGLLEHVSSEGAGQAIWVLSDGEVHNPEDALLAASEAVAAGVRVYTMGIGESVAPIPQRGGGFVRDGGEVVRSDPDPTVLKQVSQATGGAFVRSVASSEDVRGLYTREIRPALAVVERETVQREVWSSHYQWPLGLAFLCFLIRAVLGDGRVGSVRPALAVVMLVVCSLGVSEDAFAAESTTLAEADALYRAERYREAAHALEELALTTPGDTDVLNRLGSARYWAGDHEGAARAWEELLGGQTAPDAETLFQLGNAQYRSGRLEEAVRRYQEALEGSPSHERAQHNAEMVQQEIEQRRAMQPPPPPPPSEGEGEDEGEDGESEPPQDDSSGEQGSSSDQEQEASPSNAPEQQDGADEAPATPEDAEEGQEADAEATNESEGEQGEEGAEEGAAGQEGDSEGPMTEGEAHRLVDSVEEGDQGHLMIQGGEGEKPW